MCEWLKLHVTDKRYLTKSQSAKAIQMKANGCVLQTCKLAYLVNSMMHYLWFSKTSSYTTPHLCIKIGHKCSNYTTTI